MLMSTDSRGVAAAAAAQALHREGGIRVTEGRPDGPDAPDAGRQTFVATLWAALLWALRAVCENTEKIHKVWQPVGLSTVATHNSSNGA